jgi:hypothetical protein
VTEEYRVDVIWELFYVILHGLLQTTNIRLVSGFVRSELKTTQSQIGGSLSKSIVNRLHMIFYDLFLRG